jgi:hypothetical protein
MSVPCFEFAERTLGGLLDCVAEPPKLYGPHAPVIVPKTSDSYACVPYNLKSLSGVLRKPNHLHFTTHTGLTKE